ncbi:MAG: hypothetical protein QXW96_02260 [Candidatus Nitrosocaldus sp.]
MLSYQPIWFDGFIGLGYTFRNVYPCILLLFDSKKRLKEAWNKVIRLWPDDEIKIRFVEIEIEHGDDGSSYDDDNVMYMRVGELMSTRSIREKKSSSSSSKKYAFIMYCRSRILENTWVFLKLLDISDNYKRLKNEYDGKVYLDLALYITKDESCELKIFRYRKSVRDVAFLDERVIKGTIDRQSDKEKEDGVEMQIGESNVESKVEEGISTTDDNSSGDNDYDTSIVREAMKKILCSSL